MAGNEQFQFHLASESPRRRELLSGLGLRFSCGGVDLDESRLGNETVEGMVSRLAVDKVLAGQQAQASGLPVLAADTIVVLGDRVFGKPASKE
ncbi:MAG: Maf family protein, partial [Woeseiaceae bacterium]